MEDPFCEKAMRRELELTLINAQKLARLLLDIEQTKRQKIIHCLDTDFSVMVTEQLTILKRDMPMGLQDTLPPGRIPNCS